MNFYSQFQPKIVQFSDDQCLPLCCREKYMICISVLGIKWFEENYLSLEIGDLIEGEHLGPQLLMLEDSGSNKIDVPRIYVPITDKIVKNDDVLGTFYIKALTDNKIYGDGTKDFRPGLDYYVNNTLYKWLTRKEDHVGNHIHPIIEENDDIVLPDYLSYDSSTDTYKISDYFIELSDTESKTNNLTYFYNKNKLSNLEYSEEDVSFLPHTFFSIILEYTMIEQSKRSTVPNNGYDACMNYYANYKSDAATVLLQTIMNTDIVEDNNTNSTKYRCNTCTNTLTSLNNSDSIYEKSCYEKYKEAMAIWLKQMLSSLDYYNDWFMIEEADQKYPNFDMIDALIKLLNAVLEYGLWPASADTSVKYGCSCPKLDSSYKEDDCNKNIVSNYIKVLEWIKKCEMKQNTNKIKVYGKQFAELLSKY